MDREELRKEFLAKTSEGDYDTSKTAKEIEQEYKDWIEDKVIESEEVIEDLNTTIQELGLRIKDLEESIELRNSDTIR